MLRSHSIMLLCLTFLSLNTLQGCGGDDEGAAATASSTGKGGKKKGKVAKSKGNEDSLTQGQNRVVRIQGPAEAVVPLGDPSVVSDPGSVNEGLCAKLISCVKELNDQGATGLPDASTTRAQFESTEGREGECAERLVAYQALFMKMNEGDEKVSSTPSSCQ